MRRARPRIIGAAFLVAVVALAIAATEGRAQRRGRRNRIPQPSASLEAITGLECRFSAGARGSWTDGRAESATLPGGSLELAFTDIDSASGSAVIEGPRDHIELTVRVVGSNMHLLDIRPAGALGITTVFTEESRDGRLKAVHSQSDFGSGRGVATPPVATQYYGDCAVTSR